MKNICFILTLQAISLIGYCADVQPANADPLAEYLVAKDELRQKYEEHLASMDQLVRDCLFIQEHPAIMLGMLADACMKRHGLEIPRSKIGEFNAKVRPIIATLYTDLLRGSLALLPAPWLDESRQDDFREEILLLQPLAAMKSDPLSNPFDANTTEHLFFASSLAKQIRASGEGWMGLFARPAHLRKMENDLHVQLRKLRALNPDIDREYAESHQGESLEFIPPFVKRFMEIYKNHEELAIRIQGIMYLDPEKLEKN